jgi:hypothetical protein
MRMLEGDSGSRIQNSGKGTAARSFPDLIVWQKAPLLNLESWILNPFQMNLLGCAPLSQQG